MDAAALRQTLTLASVFKEGDRNVGGTADDRVRADARRALLSVRVDNLHNTALVDDGVTSALQRSRDCRYDSEIAARTVADLRAALLAPDAAD